MTEGAYEERPPVGGNEKETSRLEAFSDGVFAIAITLLVLELHVPRLGEHPSAGELWSALLSEWPSYLAFFTSFATILIMWINHHAVFRLVQRVSTELLFANGCLLLLVVTVPFPTALVAEYLQTPAASVAGAFYAGTFVVINVAYNLLWWSAARHLRPGVPASVATRFQRNYRLGFPLYIAATLLAFWSPAASMAVCFGLWILWALTAQSQGQPSSTARRTTSETGDPA